MIDVSINLSPTPSGFTHSRVAVSGPGVAAIFNSLHTSRDEAFVEALALARAEVEEMRP